MSFVLQLGTLESGHEKKNGNGQASASPEAESEPGNEDGAGKSQILQCLQENSTEIPAGHVISFSTVKSVSVTYPVAKGVREVQRIAGSQTNTSQVLTTRVISQKLPSCGHHHQVQAGPLTLNASHVTINSSQSSPSSAGGGGGGGAAPATYPLQHATAVAGKQPAARNQLVGCESKQQQQTTSSPSAVSALKVQPVRAIGSATSLPNIQRIHVKAQNLVGPGQTVNLQKVKAVSSAGQGVTVQRNSVARVQSVQKTQATSGAAAAAVQPAQFSLNQVATNNGNAARGQQGNSMLQKAQANATQKVGQVYNNQKVSSSSSSSQVLTGHPNHKTQLQQIAVNQQQGLQQKLQVQAAKNLQKSGNSVSGIQKVQVIGQVQGQQQTQKHVQSGQHQRAQAAAAASLQKSQTVVNSARVQSLGSVCKSNSVPNVAKSPQNANLVPAGKQPASNSASQMQQQSQQSAGQKQQASANPQLQRSHSITSVHQKVATVAAMPNSQRGQVVNSKMHQHHHHHQQQQQMVMRVGVPKSQAQSLQQANPKAVPQKIATPVKSANAQNTVQQAVHRNASAQPVKIIQQQQQQQQNSMAGQIGQKQPGCVKTIPPQKPGLRNHAQQKMTGIKNSLNANPSAAKGQGAAAAVAQKTAIKTLLPQQAAAANMLMHKSQPIKVQQQQQQQQQTMQQKQLIATPQFAQQVRQQSGQVKTLLPVSSAEPRKEQENKIEAEPRDAKEDERQHRPASPVIRIPPPYEDHNYGAPPPRTPSPPSPPSHPKQPVNGAGSSTTTAQHSYLYGKGVAVGNAEDDAASGISSETGRDAELEGEETETAPEGEGDDEDSVTRCICDFEHDDGYMICCDRCLVWQHVDCMGIDRSNIPDEYLCEICRPRRVDRQRARALQMRKREELLNSDTSSDTSSTSSADTDVGVNAIPKKRALQQQVPRRKSEPPQVRRLNNNTNNNNNNVAKRQRRDSHPRQSSAVRKKEATKRGPSKRKAKRRTSLEDKEEEESQDAWGSNVAPLRQWIERYEEAVTNHYSPELRARISSIKVNGTHGDSRQSNMNAIATGKCRLNVHSTNVRFLVATMYLPPNTPVVELRGKYMLSTQHRPSYPQGRQHTQRPGPFVFFYRLPRDGTEVCVDTRTYGNDARFVRRSCKPNAEVKHCIEKGTLHLYIVTTTAVEKNAEITIRHEQHDLLLSPNPNGPVVPIVCACSNPRECQIASLNQLTRRGSNGALAETADGRERRRRGRRNTVCEDSDSSTAIPSSAVVGQSTPPPTTPSSVAAAVSAPPRRTVTGAALANPIRQPAKEEAPASVQQPQTSPSPGQPSSMPETKKDKKKMTREERKMEAIMKAFERLEKAEQRKQEVQARNAQRKESGGTHSDNEDAHTAAAIHSKQRQQSSDSRPLRRKRRKGRARTSSQSQSSSSRRSRLNSADSDESSGEESVSMQSPPLSGQNHAQTRDAPYAPHLHTPGKAGNETVTASGHQGIPTAAGLLLALANSNAPPGPSSPPLQQPTPVKSPTCDSGASSSSSQSSTPSTPLSSACLLVAAAVGPLAPGFKFPKTKKVLMNEWLKESPDPAQTGVSQVSPLPALPPASASNAINPLCRSSDAFPLPADASAHEFLSQSYAAKSLATLVQAANSVSGICDSPPQRRQAVAGNSACTATTGSAKKRWLRQAISEECDSPNSRPESPPPSEMVAPPKKRRIARESLSSDNYTPPTTPTMLVPESAVGTHRSLCPTEDDFMERIHSSLAEQSEERRRAMPETVKEEAKSEEESGRRNALSVDIPRDFRIKDAKTEETRPLPFPRMGTDTSLVKEENVRTKKEEDEAMECDEDTRHETKAFVKDEPTRGIENETADRPEDRGRREQAFKSEPFETEEKGTVEIVDQHEGDTEMEDPSSPIAVMESDAVLKQRVAEMRLEFGASIAELIKENEEEDDEDKRSEDAKAEAKSDDNMSIDEFDVEAQMKKITGDDGNDYKEKIDSSSEKDKSMDGIEGLMESSKEDSESEDKDMDEAKYEPSFGSFAMNPRRNAFKEDTEPDAAEAGNGTEPEQGQEEPRRIEQPSSRLASSEESVFESASSNMDAESIAEPPKIFHSIPPLSERIRKKTETPSAPRSQLNFEAAIIESTIDMETVDGAKNGEEKSMLSTALRELLEAKLDDLTADDEKEAAAREETRATFVQFEGEPLDEETASSATVTVPASAASSTGAPLQNLSTEEAPPAKEEESPPAKEIKRLKDPRTVVPNSMPAPAFKPDTIPPVKRKLSISEYRKRKQQSSGTPPEPEPSGDASGTEKGSGRGRSDSASSGTSSLSSDEEGSKISLSLDIPSLTALPMFASAEAEEKKGGEEGTIGWSAAPTLVERQRENLTERLKREFGLFLSDDEEERARKHGLTAEAILKARKTSPPHPAVSGTPPGYPVPQLPPQPYIPPPGSASIHYSQFQAKPCPVQYPNFTVPPNASQPIYANAAAPPQTSGTTKQVPAQQFLLPQASQAPPGSNPYPPQFIPPAPPLPPPPPPPPTTAATTTPVSIAKYSAVAPPSANQIYPATGQSQKQFYNHPVPRS